MFSKPGIGKPYLPLCGTRFVAKGFAISREMACYPGGGVVPVPCAARSSR